MKLFATLGTTLLSATLLTGCMTAKPDASQYSGWMKDYSNLSEFKAPNGGTAMRWINPDLQPGQYRAVMIDSVGYYPQPQPSSQVPMKTLNEIPQYLQQQTRQEIGSVLPVVKQAGPGVLRIRAAITAVNTPTEGLQVYEVIPVALVFAGISTAAGTRDHNTVVYLEATLSDSTTGKVLGKVVRKGIGENLANKKDQLTLADTKPVLDGWAKDAAAFVGTSVK
ncbi:MAG: DUF3313 domain-containing protein [Pseudomonadales bacterium]|nr:DUF3313 domain-containing protein [Pseudomonadales bacterium]